MKRKFKVLASICSLCLAVTLMAFGVYAASSVSYKVYGKLSYAISDVFVNISAVAEQSTTKVGYANLAAATEGAKTAETAPLVIGGEQGATGYTGGVANTVAEVANEGTFNIDFADGSLVLITFTVESLSTKDVTIAIGVVGSHSNIVATASSTYTIDAGDGVDASLTTYEVVFALVNPAAEVPATAYSVSIAATLA